MDSSISVKRLRRFNASSPPPLKSDDDESMEESVSPCSSDAKKSPVVANAMKLVKLIGTNDRVISTSLPPAVFVWDHPEHDKFESETLQDSPVRASKSSASSSPSLIRASPSPSTPRDDVFKFTFSFQPSPSSFVL